MLPADPAHLHRLGFSETEIQKSLARRRPKASKRTASGVLTEHEEQKSIIRWAHVKTREVPDLVRLFAVPNGGKRTQAQAAWAKAEGLKVGVPDLWFPVSRRGYHGLVIELKTLDKASKTSPEQDDWLAWLLERGWFSKMCRGADDAIKTIAIYLGISP